MTIRSAQPKDIKAIIALCKLHATYEQASYDVSNKAKLLSEHIFEKHTIKCLVVEHHNEIVGYATFMRQFSTWDACFYMYLCCLYLKETARGNRIGAGIMERVKEIAKAEDCKFMQWQTPSINTKGVNFYTKIGATSVNKERFTWQV